MNFKWRSMIAPGVCFLQMPDKLIAEDTRSD